MTFEIVCGLDDDSILNACRLVWFDQVFRTGTRGFGDPLDAVPDHETCENVRTMVKRAATFFKQFGPSIMFVKDLPPDVGRRPKIFENSPPVVPAVAGTYESVN